MIDRSLPRPGILLSENGNHEPLLAQVLVEHDRRGDIVLNGCSRASEESQKIDKTIADHAGKPVWEEDEQIDEEALKRKLLLLKLHPTTKCSYFPK
jgi:hypothetical protein